MNPEIPETKDFTPDFQLIVRHVSQAFNTPAQEILKARREYRNSARDMSIYLCRQLTQSKLTDIGAYFNNQKYSTISSAIIRMTTELSKNPTLMKVVKQVTKEINKGQTKI